MKTATGLVLTPTWQMPLRKVLMSLPSLSRLIGIIKLWNSKVKRLIVCGMA